ncbi:MAG: hypothetical protein DRI57_28655 [Deltaproteobacteria bacterium]|nr:MAG: hypothetical protein DRI57_28655 [Deltaproteobacteria bacterium]
MPIYIFLNPYVTLAAAYLRAKDVSGYPGIERNYLRYMDRKYSYGEIGISPLVRNYVDLFLKKEVKNRSSLYRLIHALHNLEFCERKLKASKAANDPRFNYMVVILSEAFFTTLSERFKKWRTPEIGAALNNYYQDSRLREVPYISQGEKKLKCSPTMWGSTKLHKHKSCVIFIKWILPVLLIIHCVSFFFFHRKMAGRIIESSYAVSRYSSKKYNIS